MKLSVGMKIGGGFFVVLLLLCVVAVQSALVMNQTISDSGEVEQRVVRLSLDYQIADAFKEASRDLRAYLLWGDQKYAEEFEEDIKNTQTLLEKRLNNCSTQARPKLEEVLSKVTEYDRHIDSEVLPLAVEGKYAEASAAAQSVNAYGTEVNQLLTELVAENETKTGKVVDNMRNAAAMSRSTIILVSSVALLIGLFLALFITRMITRPILAT
ncbi:MAG: MCP four helix bundle domain-containing protein, partial [Bacillota bacterium]|nr:MCP four helix bundle domain-containing protein [Bacillota bacterium]